MPIRNIVVPAPGGEYARDLPLRALELAQELSAHVTATDLTISPAQYMMSGMGTVGIGYLEIYQTLQTLHEGDRIRARAFYNAAVAATKVPIADTPLCAAASTMWVDSTSMADSISTLGCLADLFVMKLPTVVDGSSPTGTLEMKALEQVLFSVRRPVLIPTSGPIRLANVAVAWNGSIEAANAVMRAHELLDDGAKITVIQVGEIRPGGVPTEALLDYLGWHCFEPELRRIPDQPKATGAALVSEAKSMGADLLIMGAYSHSRIRERVLGGVTRYVLSRSDMPLFLAH